MSFAKSFVALVMLVGFSFTELSGRVSAQEPSTSEISKVRDFLDTNRNGEYVLGFVHFGAKLKAHGCSSVARVKDSNGKLIPQEFALTYDYDWDANGPGRTRLLFFCDKNGVIKDVRVVSSTAVLHQPFKFADATIQVLGNLMIEAFKDQMTRQDRKIVETMVQNANSEGLLEFGLVFRQAANLR